MLDRFRESSSRLRESIHSGVDSSKEIIRRGGERFATGAKVAAEVGINVGTYMAVGIPGGYMIPYLLYPQMAVVGVLDSVIRQTPIHLPSFSEVHEAGLLTAAGMGVLMGGMAIWQYSQKSEFPNDSFRFS